MKLIHTILLKLQLYIEIKQFQKRVKAYSMSDWMKHINLQN